MKIEKKQIFHFRVLFDVYAMPSVVFKQHSYILYVIAFEVTSTAWAEQYRNNYFLLLRNRFSKTIANCAVIAMVICPSLERAR